MRLLICEDDISTIDVLKKQIDFSIFGIEEILEAYNGEMAIRIIEDKKPELILCDIGMPKINGIEVLKYVYENSPRTEFCFLTCYEDFEYAQIAIEYNASSYITKPFKLDQVKQALEKMISNYKKYNPNSSEEKQAKHDLIYSSMFKQVADGLYGSDINMIQNQLDINGIKFKADSSWKIVFSCLSVLETIKSTWSKSLLLYVLARVPDEVFNAYIGTAHTIVNTDDRFIWCMTFVDGDKSDEEIRQKAKELNDFCEEHFNVKPVSLISNKFAFYQTADIVRELYDNIRKVRFYGGKIFHQNDNISKTVYKNIVNESQLLWYLKNRDSGGYHEYINNLVDSIDNGDHLKEVKKEILMFFLTILKDNGISENCIFENPTLIKLDQAVVIRNNVKEYAKELFTAYQAEVFDANEQDKIISKACQYVEDNFRDDIHRKEIADMIYVSPNYFSKLFRRNVGMGFREYVNKLRIEESKRLLLSTNMSISEIAVYIGYFNISYFSTVFHKLVGVSPVEYRLNSTKEE